MIPIGIITAYYGDARTFDATGPWLICDGSAISRTQYPDLYNHLVRINPDLKIDSERCTIPDLRGMFLRGHDDGRGIDQDRVLGTTQQSALEKQTANIGVPSPAGPGSSRGLDGGTLMFVRGEIQKPITFGSAKETRPVNVAVNWIIRAKP